MSNKTYAELEANLKAWIEDDDAEFDTSIDDIINLGEMRLWKDLDLDLWSTIDTVATVASTATVTPPTTDSELVSYQTIYYDSGSERTFLELRSYDFVIDHQTPGSTGAPRYYAQQDETTWVLSPIPDDAYTLNCRGITHPTRLSSGNTTTWLSQHMDDMLFKACLAEAEKFVKADDRIPVWENDYQSALPGAKRETYVLLRAHYQLTPLQYPGVPTIQR